MTGADAEQRPVVEAAGPGFRFDVHMRDFLARSDGTRTLADGVQHWHRTRSGGGRSGIDEQFELDRLARRWYEAHPEGTREEFLAAWRAYRALPVERRGRI